MVVNYLIFFLIISATSLNISSAQNCRDQANSFIASGVSEEDIEFIVNKHNEIRSDVANGRNRGQPKGNIPNLVWDEELATKAQAAADTCVFEHVDVEDSRFYVGQNLYMQKATAKKPLSEWKKAIQSWLNEGKNYKYGPFDHFSLQSGDYTQMIWAESEKVGCGYTLYETDDSMRYHKIYVCNYGPGGNMLGEYPYQQN